MGVISWVIGRREKTIHFLSNNLSAHEICINRMGDLTKEEKQFTFLSNTSKVLVKFARIS